MTYRSYPPSSSLPQQSGNSLVLDREPLLVAAAGPARQSRATVAFRIILVIPHLVVLYFVGVAASVVAFIGWFGALFTGRLPDFAADFLSGYVRWYCRVGAYLLLLTDEYPPFLLNDADYPVRLVVSPGRLNRLAVLFRLVLAIPAGILSIITQYGVATIVIFIAWLIALVAGKLPRSLHQAFAAVLRYNARYYGYLYLLTDTYPRGLFGDKPGSEPNDAFGGPGWGSSGPGYGAPDPRYGAPDPRYGAPDPAYGRAAYNAPSRYGTADYASAPPGYGGPGYAGEVPGYGEPASGYPATRVASHRAAAAVEAPGRPASWQMVLPAGAKFVVGLVLVLGLATTVGASFSSRSVISAIRRGNEINQLNSAVAANNVAIAQNQKAVAQVNSALARLGSAHTKLGSQMDLVVKATGQCSSLGCVNAEALRAAGHVATFGRRLRAVAIPAKSAAAESKLVPDVTHLRQAWASMGHSVSFTDFGNRATRGEKAGRRFDQGYRALVASLNKRGAALSKQAASLNQRSTSLNRQIAALNAG